jgi:peptide/nickel transport system substrate-binding protein
LLGKSPEKFRLNPRKAWYQNLEEVTTKGDDEVAFHLKRPQPSFIALLASGWSAVYPCHVTPREMRNQPIGTGPFKLVEFKPNEGIKVTRNPDYWKKDRPYLDGIEYTIIKNASTRVLAFIAGKFDMTTPYNLTIPLMRDIQSQAPDAICELTPTNVSRNQAALRQPGDPAGIGADPGPQGLHRHDQRRQGRYRRRDAAAAGGCLGNADGDADDLARLRSRRREEPQ